MIFFVAGKDESTTWIVIILSEAFVPLKILFVILDPDTEYCRMIKCAFFRASAFLVCSKNNMNIYIFCSSFINVVYVMQS